MVTAAVKERVLKDLQEERNGAAGPEEDALMGLVWLKCGPQVSCLGLDKALRRAARLHKGLEGPVGGPDGEAPSAVICCASGEEEIAPEVKSARALAPNAAVVLVLAPSPNLPLARKALEAGASGLLHAGMRPEQIIRAVRVALQGETVLPRGLLTELLEEQRPQDLKDLLSARQRQILGLVAQGSTNAEVGRRLYLSESTVKQHLRATYKALGVRNRREAAASWRKFSRGYV